MRSRIKFEYESNGNLTDITQDGDKIYQGQVATAEYSVKMADEIDTENWLPTDAVLISFIRPDLKAGAFLMTYDPVNEEWVYTSNGWETDVDISASSDLTIAFAAKRYSILDATILIKTLSSENAVLTIYPSAGFTPLEIAADTAEEIIARLVIAEGDIDDLQALTAQHTADIADKVDKITTIAGIDLQNSITAYDLRVELNLNNVENTSDLNKPVSTAQQTALDLKANIASPTFTGIPAVPTAAAGTNTTQTASTAFVKSAVDTAISSAYKVKGSVADYTALLALTGMVNGDVYSVTAAHTTEPIFNAGTNFVWIVSAAAWDNIGGIVDLSGKADKVTGATSGNFAGLDANGNLTDSGKKGSDFLETGDIYDWAKANVKPSYSASEISDEFFVWESVTVLSNAFEYDCSLRKNYILSNGAEIALTITGDIEGEIANPVNGFKGCIITNQALTLPVNSSVHADFGYITITTEFPLYKYEFDCIEIGETMYYSFSRVAIEAIVEVA